MESRSYEFEHDENECADDYVSLDDWKPAEKKVSIVQSEWRKNKIGQNYNQRPGRDDLKKIKLHVGKKTPDYDIMNAFGITCETLLAIKKNKYSAEEGIALDDQAKIYKAFEKIENDIGLLQRAIDFIASTMFIDKISLDLYKHACKKPKLVKTEKSKKDDFDEDEEEDDIF